MPRSVEHHPDVNRRHLAHPTLERVDEVAEPIGQLGLLVEHRPRVVDHEQDVELAHRLGRDVGHERIALTDRHRRAAGGQERGGQEGRDQGDENETGTGRDHGVPPQRRAARAASGESGQRAANAPARARARAVWPRAQCAWMRTKAASGASRGAARWAMGSARPGPRHGAEPASRRAPAGCGELRCQRRRRRRRSVTRRGPRTWARGEGCAGGADTGAGRGVTAGCRGGVSCGDGAGADVTGGATIARGRARLARWSVAAAVSAPVPVGRCADRHASAPPPTRAAAPTTASTALSPMAPPADGAVALPPDADALGAGEVAARSCRRTWASWSACGSRAARPAATSARAAGVSGGVMANRLLPGQSRCGVGGEPPGPARRRGAPPAAASRRC